DLYLPLRGKPEQLDGARLHDEESLGAIALRKQSLVRRQFDAVQVRLQRAPLRVVECGKQWVVPGQGHADPKERFSQRECDTPRRRLIDEAQVRTDSTRAGIPCSSNGAIAASQRTNASTHVHAAEVQPAGPMARRRMAASVGNANAAVSAGFARISRPLCPSDTRVIMPSASVPSAPTVMPCRVSISGCRQTPSKPMPRSAKPAASHR